METDTVYASHSWTDTEINSTATYEIMATDCFGNKTEAVSAFFTSTEDQYRNDFEAPVIYPNSFHTVTRICYIIPNNNKGKA